MNAASETCTRLVAEIDNALKPLNIGITSWVTIRRWSDETATTSDLVGYAKIGGKWGIALSTQYEYFDQEDSGEVWAFSEGPRRLRLEAIDYLSPLLEKLAAQVTVEAKRLAPKLGELELLVGSLMNAGGK